MGLFAIFAALTLTVFSTFHSKIITVTVLFLAPTLLTIAAFELHFGVLLLVPEAKSPGIPDDYFGDGFGSDLFCLEIVAAV